jgi:DNA-binding XRE family transcriptional regulator
LTCRPAENFGGFFVCRDSATNTAKGMSQICDMPYQKESLLVICDNPMSDIVTVLGKNIKYYRAKLGLTQEDLARLSGVNRSHLASIESGTLNTSIRIVDKLAKALGVSASDLLKQPEGE